MIHSILQLMQAKGSGEASLRRFLSFAVTHGEDAASAICSSAESLEREVGVKPDVARNIVEARPTTLKIADELTERGVRVLWHGCPEYPERLARILQNEAPPVLFVQGNQDLLNASGVGFCGSRKASEKGLAITGRCAMQLARDGICVVSGYAHGVDMAAHKAALENGGTTILVLVEGILRFQRKHEIADLLSAANSLVVSQFPPRLTWSARNAMRRNSTIIGLSDAMILVESGLTGGTFAAGEETLRRRRPLFVIDFAEPGPSAEANPHFIRQGGMPVRGNREGMPTLDKVKVVVAEQSWRQPPPDEPSLFNWNQDQ
jgi:DNA protecting protein DprA